MYINHAVYHAARMTHSLLAQEGDLLFVARGLAFLHLKSGFQVRDPWDRHHILCGEARQVRAICTRIRPSLVRLHLI